MLTCLEPNGISLVADRHVGQRSRELWRSARRYSGRDAYPFSSAMPRGRSRDEQFVVSVLATDCESTES